MFIEKMKYSHHDLGKLASSLTDNEKLAVRTECKKFIKKDENLAKKFNLYTKEDQEWVLDNLSTGKGTIPYEMITRYDSYDISLEDGKFFFSLIIFIQALNMI